MRAVIQRVARAAVRVDGICVGEIARGFLVLLGIHVEDTEREAEFVAGKVARLRVFPDAEGKMNLALGEIDGAALVVSQFTLYGDARKGNRPSFIEAARPETAAPLYQYFCNCLEKQKIPVERGVFGADMKVELLNDGPVTLIVESLPPA